MLSQKRTLALLTALIVIVVGVVGVYVFSQSEDDDSPAWEEAVATLRVTEGRATINGDTDPQAIAAGERRPVRAGDRITVADDGEAVLTFFTGAETVLAPGTELEVRVFRQAGESVQIELDLLAGQAFNRVEQALDADSRFEMDTPVANIAIRGTDYVVFVRPAALTQVATMVGEVEVTAGGRTETVLCGYGVWIDEDGTLSERLIWGQADMQANAPVDELPPVVVMFHKQDNDQTFRYRMGDAMPVPLGTYDVTVHTPGPAVVRGVEFPEDTALEQLQAIPVELGAVVLDTVDATGQPIDEPLTVTLTQDDLTGSTTAESGTPILAGPGTWQISAAPQSQPDDVQTAEVTVAPGQQVSVELVWN
jgi:hypothetical protein